MIEIIIDLIKRVMEKEEKSRKFAVTLADSYLRRVSRFQDQLVLLGVVLNFLAVGYVVMSPMEYVHELRPIIIAAVFVFLVNMLLAKLYSNEHRTTKLLFARYPELELIMVGDKSWSNFRVLVGAYKLVQAGWMLTSAVLAGFLINYYLK